MLGSAQAAEHGSTLQLAFRQHADILHPTLGQLRPRRDRCILHAQTERVATAREQMHLDRHAFIDQRLVVGQ